MKKKGRFKVFFGSKFLLLICAAVLLSAPFASATTIYSSNYTNMASVRGTWLTNLGITAPDTTIDFESGFYDDQSILGYSLSGGLVITSPEGYGYVTDDSGNLGDSSPIDTYALAVDERDAYTFSFNSAISYFAFYMMDNSETSLTINFSNGTSETTAIPGGGSAGLSGTFFAVSFEQNVDSLFIPYVRGGDSEVGIDNIEFGFIAQAPPTPGAVPEPSTMLLLGMGLIGLCGMSRRFKK